VDRSAHAGVDVVIIKLPRIANFDDFDPLVDEPGVGVRYVSTVEALGRPHAVILPGSKSTMADLAWLQAQGLAEAIERLAANGAAVVGICGGYQMLGRVIRDPQHTESAADEAPGLGLLPLETVFSREKATHRAEARVLEAPGWLAPLAGQVVQGYEIHMGRTLPSSQTDGRPWLKIVRRSGQLVSLADGATSADGRVWGCYLHGLFANETLRRAWLAGLGWREVRRPGPRQAAFDRLADQVEAALDMRRLAAILGDEGERR
jgi:adenosylcobyric acid synthase